MPEEVKTTQAKLSIKEFTMWLQGVEEMQEDGWHPNPVQWKKIREKLDLVTDSSPTPASGVKPTGPIAREAAPRLPPPGPAVPAGPSGLMSTTPRPPVPRADLPVSLSSTPAGSVKTPDIDTSSGSYKSQFA